MEALTKFQNQKIKHTAIKIAVIVSAAAFTWGGVALILVSGIFEPPKPDPLLDWKLEIQDQPAMTNEQFQNIRKLYNQPTGKPIDFGQPIDLQ
jgi:hypothetical protein